MFFCPATYHCSPVDLSRWRKLENLNESPSLPPVLPCPPLEQTAALALFSKGPFARFDAYPIPSFIEPMLRF